MNTQEKIRDEINKYICEICEDLRIRLSTKYPDLKHYIETEIDIALEEIAQIDW